MLIGLILLAILVVVGLGVALAVRGKQSAADNLRLAPGLTSNAPKEWAGSHSPEAKLHRRLRAAARSIDQAPMDSVVSIEQRVAVQQQIVQVDNQLVAAAAVPGDGGVAALARIDALVVAVEASAAKVLFGAVDPGWLEKTQAELDNSISSAAPEVVTEADAEPPAPAPPTPAPPASTKPKPDSAEEAT